MAAKSGDSLLQSDAIDLLRERMLPLARIITPNLPEAGALLGEPPPGDEAQMARSAEKLLDLGPAAVLLEPGVLARWTLDSGPIKGTGGYICEPTGDDTRFTLEAHVTPTGWYRLLGPIFGMMGRRQNLSDVRKLKTILENQPDR